MTSAKITLAIESAIGSGSLSLIRGDTEIDSWIGTESVSRAEDLLEQISLLLANNQIIKEEIDLIAVSNDAGSHTGLRIGLATAFGLSRAGGSKVSSIPLLTALAICFKDVGKMICAASGNLKSIYAQVFEFNLATGIVQLTEPKSFTRERFLEMTEGESADLIIGNESVHELLMDDQNAAGNCINAGKNLAQIVGLVILQHDLSEHFITVYS